MENLETIAKSGEFSAASREISQSAMLAYDMFWEKSHLNHERESAEQFFADNYRNLKNFCGKGEKAVHPWAYEAQYMGLLADISYANDNYGGAYAKNAMQNYIKNYENENGHEAAIYIAELLGNRMDLRNFWNEHSPMDPPCYEGEWGNFSKLVDLDDTVALAEKINVESMLIAAAESVTELDYHLRPTNLANNRTILNTIRLCEALQAPSLEIMGYDAFSMNLNDITNQIRLRNMGYKGEIALEIAKNKLLRYNPQDVSLATTDIVGTALGGQQSKEPITEYDTDSGIIMEHGYCRAGNDLNYFVARRKTHGSLARKIYREIEKLDWPMLDQAFQELPELATPMDIIGIHAIFSNHCELARAFSNATRAATNHPAFELCAAPSRDSAVHIRGANKFCDKIRKTLHGDTFDCSIDKKNENPGGMEIAKLTFLYHQAHNPVPLRAEIQFTTNQRRKAMRLEEISHIGYKLGVKLNKHHTMCLKRINQRKDDVGKGILVNPSAGERSLAYMKEYGQARPAVQPDGLLLLRI